MDKKLRELERSGDTKALFNLRWKMLGCPGEAPILECVRCGFVSLPALQERFKGRRGLVFDFRFREPIAKNRGQRSFHATCRRCQQAKILPCEEPWTILWAGGPFGHKTLRLEAEIALGCATPGAQKKLEIRRKRLEREARLQDQLSLSPTDWIWKYILKQERPTESN